MLASTSALPQRSRLSMATLTLVNRQDVYAHNDPAGAIRTGISFLTPRTILETGVSRVPIGTGTAF
jgi:hypothetical protein